MNFTEQWDELMTYLRDEAETRPEAFLGFAYLLDSHRSKPWFLKHLNVCMEAIMARGKSNGKPAQATKAQQWTTFVEIPIPASAYPEVLRTYGTIEEIHAGLTELMATGHRVSFSYNQQNDSVICAITGKGDNCQNDGLTMTSFASDWSRALQVALYKHFVIASGDWNSNKVMEQKPLFG